MESAPTARVVVVHLATPPTRTTLTQPEMGLPLLVKVTVPVGVPPPGGLALTVSVKVTDWPDADPDGADELSTEVVESPSTTCVSGAEVEVAKLALPR